MSCEGWGVGDRCKARVAFEARQKQMNGPDSVSQIYAGDEGRVREKLAHVHMLYVLWDRLGKSLPITHEQVHLLDRIPSAGNDSFSSTEGGLLES